MQALATGVNKIPSQMSQGTMSTLRRQQNAKSVSTGMILPPEPVIIPHECPEFLVSQSSAVFLRQMICISN